MTNGSWMKQDLPFLFLYGYPRNLLVLVLRQQTRILRATPAQRVYIHSPTQRRVGIRPISARKHKCSPLPYNSGDRPRIITGEAEPYLMLWQASRLPTRADNATYPSRPTPLLRQEYNHSPHESNLKRSRTKYFGAHDHPMLPYRTLGWGCLVCDQVDKSLNFLSRHQATVQIF